MYAYLQCLRAGWKPGENINVKAGDGVSLPLGALADSRAAVRLLRRAAADLESDERKQRTCYHHLHTGSRFKNIPNDFCFSLTVLLVSTATRYLSISSKAV